MSTTNHMNHDIFAIRLHEARQMTKLSMEKLAELTGYVVTKQSISKYEKGKMMPKHDAMAALAKALNICEDYLRGKGIRLNTPMLRRRLEGKISGAEALVLEARLAFWAEQYLCKEKKAGYGNHFINPMAGVCVSTMEDAQKAADLLRKQWHCGDGTIASVLRLMERKGIKILSTKLPDGVLGLSTWADNTLPLVVVDMRPERTSVERLRFTAVHELAHLLLTIPTDSELTIEKRCDLFAGFFLMPKQTLIEEMGAPHRNEVALEEMIDLKEQYGISLQALIITARYYGVITAEYKRWWYDTYLMADSPCKDCGHYPFPETLGKEKRIDLLAARVDTPLSPVEKAYDMADINSEMECGMAAEEIRIKEK